MFTKRIRPALRFFAAILLVILGTTRSNWYPQDISDQVGVYTRNYEFDYFYWTLESLGEKASQAALGIENSINSLRARLIIHDFLNTITNIHDLENQILQTYSDPNISDPEGEARVLIDQKEKLEAAFGQQRLVAESILQSQISTILNRKGLDFIFAPFPPVLFKITSLPDQLIVSPRSVIRQDASISLKPGLTDQQKDELERKVSSELDLSALVVPLGGVGVYPTMVYRDAELEYLIKVIAHEWIHNYLAFKPLGWHYDASPQLRTMNETTADICATEISQAVLRSYYADQLTPKPNPYLFAVRNTGNQSFDFNKEMHATRVAVDELLSQGKISDAENLMEEKRKFFWENGYQIRKLNQAYFAFYGAYAEQPLGAAGNDPVGPAVRALRAKSSSLLGFLKRIEVMTSFEQLQQAVSS